MSAVAVVLSVLIVVSSCLFALGSTDKDKPKTEEKKTSLVPVTKENGESVTDDNGEQVYEVTEITETTTEKKGLLDKIFGKDEDKTEKEGSSETTTKKQNFIDKIFGNDEKGEEESSSSTTTTELGTTTSADTSTEATTKKDETSTTSTTERITESTTESATKEDTTSNELYSFEYIVESNGYITITGYTGNASVVTIPAMIDGAYVDEIAKGAISNDSKITKIIFESGRKVTTLNTGSFNNLSSLITVDLGNSGYTIWGHFAIDCPIKTFENPNKYTIFNEGGLYNSNGELLYFCENPCYSTLTIPSWSSGIRNGSTLQYNDNLKEINAHKDITNLPQSYLYYNEALEAINIESGNSRYMSKDGVLFYKIRSDNKTYDYTIYPYSKKDKSFVMPENCKLTTRGSNYITNPYLETLYIPKSSTLKNPDSSWFYTQAFSNIKNIYLKQGHSQYDTINKTFTGNIYTY